MIKYPVSQPDLSGNELKYVTEAITSGWISSKGPFVEALEKKFAEYIGTKYAVACSSGTTALTLAMSAIGIKPGDEVIVPDFTMIASAYPVAYHSATPVFVDCGDDLNIDVSKIEEKITSKTKAIVVTHIYGRAADMDAIQEIAYRYNLYVIEDACEAHGATIHGKKVGSFGDIGCFSLFANKIISSGEGGLITTNDERLYKQLQHLRSMAFNTSHDFFHPKIAYNFRMTSLQAGVALAQLERIDQLLAERKRVRDTYDTFLKAYTIPRPEGSVMWMYDIILPKGIKNTDMVAKLAECGIESRLFFKPMSLQPPFGGKKLESKAQEFSERGLYLPTYTTLKNEEIEEIAQTVMNILKTF